MRLASLAFLILAGCQGSWAPFFLVGYGETDTTGAATISDGRESYYGPSMVGFGSEGTITYGELGFRWVPAVQLEAVQFERLLGSWRPQTLPQIGDGGAASELRSEVARLRAESEGLRTRAEAAEAHLTDHAADQPPAPTPDDPLAGVGGVIETAAEVLDKERSGWALFLWIFIPTCIVLVVYFWSRRRANGKSK